MHSAMGVEVECRDLVQRRRDRVHPPLRRRQEAAVAVWDQAKTELGCTPDVFLPMTHQLVAPDRDMCVALGKHLEVQGARSGWLAPGWLELR
jgi:hypothetical protein